MCYANISSLSQIKNLCSLAKVYFYFFTKYIFWLSTLLNKYVMSTLLKNKTLKQGKHTHIRRDVILIFSQIATTLLQFGLKTGRVEVGRWRLRSSVLWILPSPTILLRHRHCRERICHRLRWNLQANPTRPTVRLCKYKLIVSTAIRLMHPFLDAII